MAFSDKELFMFEDIKKELDALGKGEWVTLYANEKTMHSIDSGLYYSALASVRTIKTITAGFGWDLYIGEGKPGFTFSWRAGKEIAKYYRFSKSGIEPLIYHRFFGSKQLYKEVSEEFRLFFDLFENYTTANNKTYALIDENGDEEFVVTVQENLIQAKLKYIKKYISARKMVLVVYFDFTRYSNNTLAELAISNRNQDYRDGQLFYNHAVSECDFREDARSISRLVGKKIVSGIKGYKPALFDTEGKKFEEFIIGFDEHGNEVSYTCNEDHLANYFGKNPGKPHYLTPVFFRKDVLNKYYNNPQRYSVEDGSIKCKGIWVLRIDNNHPNYVSVFLGDLGHLSHKEQLYWKSCNVGYSGPISEVAIRRAFLGEFADPSQIDLVFKMKFELFKEKWFKKFGWHLFKPLSCDDKYYWDSLHVPTTDDQKEFDDQVLAFTKIVIDSLNELKLSENIVSDKPSPKGIDKFEAFLFDKGQVESEIILYLRNLQTLRSTSVAHRKSEHNKDYKKVKKYFNLETTKRSKVFEEILIKGVWVLKILEDNFLTYDN